jgi:hypothetical protein
LFRAVSRDRPRPPNRGNAKLSGITFVGFDMIEILSQFSENVNILLSSVRRLEAYCDTLAEAIVVPDAEGSGATSAEESGPAWDKRTNKVYPVEPARISGSKAGNGCQ